jgi:ABC-type transport system involved in cytochrome bd biosynthesis fused ATPase/permease subunit
MSWIREALREPPPGSRVALVLTWARTLALAGTAAAHGTTADAALAGRSLMVPALSALALAVLAAAAGAGAEARVGAMAQASETDWRQRVMRAALAPGRGDRDGQTLDAATVGVEKVAAYRAGFLTPTLAAFTAPLLVLGVWAAVIDPVGALVLLAAIALVPPLIVLGDRVLRRSNGAFRRAQSRAAARYLELVEGLGTLSVLGAGQRVLGGYAATTRESMRELTRLLARNQLVIVVHDAVFGVLMGCVAAALVLDGLASGRIGPGQALTGVLLIVLLQEPMGRIGRTFYVALGGRARRDQLEQLVGDAEPDDGESVDGGAVDRGAVPGGGRADEAAALVSRADGPGPALHLQGVGVDRDGAPVLDGVDLALPAGARIALVGPSGAGKTTLLRVLSGLEEPGRGTIRLGGAPADAAARRRRCATLTQHVSLLSGTLADNLRLVSPSAGQDRRADALDDAGLAPDLRAMPEGEDTRVGEDGALLSGGQRRRLGLARLLVQDRDLVLLDEPTADLDRATETLVRERLDTLLRGRTVLEVSHCLRTTLDADLVVVLEDGAVTAVGPPALVRSRPGYYAEALEAESADDPAPARFSASAPAPAPALGAAR